MVRGDDVVGDPGPSEMLFLYGLMTMIVGALAFSEEDMGNAELTPIFLSNAAAAFIFACAAAVRPHGAVQKGDPKWREYMVGLHLALVLPPVYAVAFGVRGYMAYADPEKRHAAKYMAFHVLAAIAAFVAMVRFRRKTPKVVGGKAEAEADAAKPVEKTPAKGKGKGKGKVKKTRAAAGRAKVN